MDASLTTRFCWFFFSKTKQAKKEMSKAPYCENDWVNAFRSEEARRIAKYDRLKELDLLVFDNSVRESTVGQLRGHTAEDKFRIY